MSEPSICNTGCKPIARDCCRGKGSSKLCTIRQKCRQERYCLIQMHIVSAYVLERMQLVLLQQPALPP